MRRIPVIVVLSTAFFFLVSDASAQLGVETVFAPNGNTSVGDVSGDDDCGLDPVHCGPHKSTLWAESGEVDQHFSTLQFGFTSGSPCAFQAPRPTGTITINDRVWNECPNDHVNRWHTLNTTSLSGPDYGLKRIRICTDNSGQLAGAEARFFKYPHLNANQPTQDIAIRTFERNDCSQWQDWSFCPRGQAANGIALYSQNEHTGDVEGVQLRCREVVPQTSGSGGR